ncbi:S1 family peptidase [Psychrobacter communis]|uniref:Trypsin-like peptidase domain-containing protein n=1 Tax=Psychrobacter communis TaxID=2762238 RepID=A0ABR8RLS5_9GAMM|nr:serine protease [Psychrobacter communis]MBD7948725.1 trypsin-like peptidase domain-containing protein [Psychrobacter communis]
MSQSLSTAESLLYSTVKITSISNGKEIGTGTAFYSIFNRKSDSLQPVLITNKHVVDGADKISIRCHIADPETYELTGRLLDVTVALHDTLLPHPDNNIDLCAISIGSILQQAIDQKIPIFYAPVTMDWIPDEEEWQYFDSIEDITMVGCPRGLTDEKNNFPIVRKGITATSPNKDYNGKKEFMVDMACFPGSSGSPIFLYNANGYLNRKTQSYLMGETRLKLLGILYGGPTLTNSGQIILNKGFEFEVSSMMHLGFAIKSTEIKVLEKHALKVWV